MSEFIQNVPIVCNACSYSPVPGKEETVKFGNKMMTECKWTCPRCGRLVRRDEKTVEIKNDKKDQPK